MHHMKTGFLLVSLAFCLGFVFGADAAPSVRVLGSGAGYSAGTKAANTNATPVAKGETTSAAVLNAGAGAKKAASAKAVAPKTASVAPVVRSASNRPGTIANVKKVGVNTVAGGSDNTERFPGISTKANIQNIGKVGTVTGGGQVSTPTSGYNVKEMNERLIDVEGMLKDKIDATKLDEYYTKEYIDANYYTNQAIEERLNDIDASASSQYIQTLTGYVEENTRQIRALAATGGGILDTNSGVKQNVYVETTFNDSIFDEVDTEPEEGQ